MSRPGADSSSAAGTAAERLPAAAPPAVSPSAAAVWWRWFVSSTAGETVGFVAPAVAGVLTASSSARLALPVLVLAGAIEGAALAWAQGWALRPLLPGLRRARFAGLTAAAAALAYALGMTPSAIADSGATVPVPFVVAAVAAGAVPLLGSIGTAQWLELRRCLSHSSSWILTTGLSWSAGLAVFSVIAMPLWHEGQAPLLTWVIGVAAAAVMAATVAALTGWAMVRLLRRHAVLH